MFQHYIDLNTQYLLVQDSGTSGYLRMQGSTASEYIPMVPSLATDSKVEPQAASDKAESEEGEEDEEIEVVSIHSNLDENCDNTDKTLTTGLSLSTPQEPVWKPLVEVENENELEDAEDNEESPEAAKKHELRVSISLGGAIETTAMVHPEPKDSPTDSHSDNSYEEERNSPVEPFLSRSGSDQSDRGGTGRRGRKGYKCNDSVASDTSSGFHSDYVPDMDNSATPEYSIVLRRDREREIMV